MDAPKIASQKREEFIDRHRKWIVDILKGDFWIIKRRRWLKWLFVCLCSPTLIGMVLAFALLVGFFGIIGFMYFYDSNLKDDTGKPIDWNKIKNSDFKKATIIRDQNGQITDRFFFEIRDPLKENEIPDLLANAFIAAEDENFWIHPGVDPTAIARAALGNSLRQFGINWWAKAGGSTITMQLARTAYGEDVAEFGRRDHTWKRKIKETHFAIQLEKHYTKKEILTAFLNYIYLGHSRYGVAEACRHYFGYDKNLKAITPRQVAIIASLNKAPTKYCPIFHEAPKPTIPASTPDDIRALIEKEYESKRDKEKFRVSRVRERDNWALFQLREEGYISNEQYHASLFDEKENLTELADLKITPVRNPAIGYASRMIKEALLGMNYEDEEITNYGGFQIKTCADSQIQNILNDKLVRHLAELNSEVQDKSNPIDGSAGVMDVENGCMVAIFGGHDFRESPYNRLMALRSIGSGAKPFVYGAAFEYAGMNLNDYIRNVPFSRRGADGKPWSPKNFPEDNPVPEGFIPIYVGQIRSVNRPTVDLANKIGMDKIVLFAHQLGIWGNYGIVKDPQGNIVFRMPGVRDQGDRIVPLLPTAIGASDVNLLELVTAYAAFFREGQYLPPKLVLEVSDSEGKILYKSPNIKPKQQISRETAIKELILLRMTTEVGTAKISMRNKDEEQQYGVKTGTSNNPDPKQGEGPGDVGMYGGSPKYVMAIRLGHDKPKPIIIPNYMRKVSRQNNMRVSGGWVVGFLFREIMDEIHAGMPVIKFPPAVEEGLVELLANYPDKYK